ncbi:hypothetical protein D3C72_1924970 [compost metagenome]
MVRLLCQFCPTNLAETALPINLPTTAIRTTQKHVCQCSASLSNPIWVRNPVNTKNSGKRSTCATSSTFSINILLKLVLLGMITPAIKAPNNAWIPITSVVQEEMSNVRKNMPTIDFPRRSFVVCRSPIRCRKGFTNRTIKKT